MEPLFEVLLQLFLEIFGDVVLDALVRSRNPIASTIGNSIIAGLFALILVAFSLAIHPAHFITSSQWRMAALVVLPVLNGFLMFAVGRQFLRHGRIRSGFEHFIPAFVFSFTFGLLRYVWAR